MRIAIVPGYGVPTDIFNDETYKKYFRIVECWVDQCEDEEINLIFCGGNTDLDPPYDRIEAEEMKKLWEKKFLWKNVRVWTEKDSLSSLDNQMGAKKIMDANGWKVLPVLFCERTRLERIRIIGKWVYGSEVEVVPVDLYTEEQLKDLTLMTAKEEAQKMAVLWAIQNETNLNKYRQMFVEKFRILREAKPWEREEKLKEMYGEMARNEQPQTK